jgi:hypothetical protein
MRKTRLFPALVLYGVSLTGGAVATVATVSLAVAGCGDDTKIEGDPDLPVPLIRDMAVQRPD